MSQSLRFSSLALFALSTGCSDLWTTYQIEENVPPAEDMASVETCKTPGKAFLREGSVYTACCESSQNDGTDASHIQATFSEALGPNGPASPTIKFSCTNKDIYFSRAHSENTAIAPITKNTTVEGGRNVFIGGGSFRFFRVLGDTTNPASNGSLYLQDLVLQYGVAKDYPEKFPHGFDPATNPPTRDKFGLGGAILASGEVKLERVGIRDSKAEGAEGACGGAIFISGAKLTLINTILYQNKTRLTQTFTGYNSCHLSGAAIKSVNSGLDISYSSIVRNDNLGETSTKRGIIDIIATNQSTAQVAVSITNSLLINYQISLLQSNISATLNCSNGRQITWAYSQTATSTVLDKIWNGPHGGSCNPSYTIGPNPAKATLATAIANPFSGPSPAFITLNADTDKTIFDMLQWKADNSFDYYGVKRDSARGNALPGAVFTKQR